MQVNEDKRVHDEQGEKYTTAASFGDVDHCVWSKAGSDGGQRNRSMNSSKPHYAICRGD